ncbi:Acetyltransferase (GNAT) family protein [Pseudomonas sp. UC 17F4]|nr:Acetyltransferase (GNAT) family protein [Pseudomonas sp. UC 17F4]
MPTPAATLSVSASLKSQQCWVALRAGAVIGYVVLTYHFFDHGFVSLVVVAPGHQRQGVASRLLAAAEAACTTAKLFVSTNQSNLASRQLILKAGFVPSGVIENLDEHDPELVYFKRIRA